MKKSIYHSIILLLTLFFLSSCSSYTVEKCLINNESLKTLKKSGIIARVPNENQISSQDILANINIWINGFKQNNKIKLIKKTNKSIQSSNTIQTTFYQKSENNEFLKFKSMGVITLFLASNKDDLKKIIQDNNLDSLIIYEVNSSYSQGIQFIDFNSMIIILNENLNIIYSDHQTDSFESNEYEEALLKEHLLNKISGRLLNKLKDFEYIKEK